jgi:site-specific recombinase XerD
MLELCYATGLRRSELTHLRVFDLDIERLTLVIRQGKGRKDRMISTGARAGALPQRHPPETRGPVHPTDARSRRHLNHPDLHPKSHSGSCARSTPQPTPPLPPRAAGTGPTLARLSTPVMA